MHAAVFLDRDNTLIHNDGDLGDPSLVRIIQGVPSAIASLRGLGYKIVVVTNQGGVARGLYNEEAVDAVNTAIHDEIHRITGATIDRFYYCPFHPDGVIEEYRREHPWRKPNPGMILQAAEDMEVDLSQSWMIGDQMRDVEAGIRAGVRTILLTEKAGLNPPLKQDKIAELVLGRGVAVSELDGQPILPQFVARNLVEAVRIIAQQRKPEVAEQARTLMPAAKLPPAKPAPIEPRKPAAEEPASKQALPKKQPSVWVDPRREPQPTAPAAYAAQAAADAPASQPVSSAAESLPSTGSQAVPTATQPAPAAPAAGEVGKEAASGKRAATPTLEHSLREMLAEMRNQRTMGTEFSYMGVIAIVLQMVAAMCLAGALLLGREDPAAFGMWIQTGILVQLATIAMLQFRR